MSAMLSYLKPDFVINGRYRITRRIGVGGFAVVFEAMDQQIDRLVAVKVLNSARFVQEEEVQSLLLERFEREAKLAAKVQHSNVMSIFDFGVIEEHMDPFIVMELLNGHDLDRQISKYGAMPPSHVIPLFIDCLNALGVAHDLGIVHKDLKPSNLFLKNPGERFESLCIVDFGIAHINEAFRKRLTQVGQILGTPDYLAPEYITEQVVSAALDVYQMGLILVEALMGEPVIKHPDRLVAMLMHVRGEIKVPSALIASPLGPVLRKALAYEPTSRYRNALEFADALADVNLKEIPLISASDPRELIAPPPEGMGVPSSSTPPAAEQPNSARPLSGQSSPASGNLSAPSKPSSEIADHLDVASAPTEFEAAEREKILNLAKGNPNGASENGNSVASSSTELFAGGVTNATPSSGISQPLNSPSSSPQTPMEVQQGLKRAKPQGDTAEMADRDNHHDAMNTHIFEKSSVDLPAVDRHSANRSDDGAQKKLIAVALSAAVVVLIVAGVIGVFASGDSPEDIQPAEVVAHNAVEDIPKAEDELAHAASDFVDQEEEVQEPAEEVAPSIDVVVVTDPPDALVYDGRIQLGTTPLTLTFDNGAPDTRTLRLEHEGFQATEIEVSAENAPQFVTKLEAKRPEPTRRQVRRERQPAPQPKAQEAAEPAAATTKTAREEVPIFLPD